MGISYCEGREIRAVASLKIARTNANDFVLSFPATMGTAIPSSGKWGCPIVTRQIIRRVIEMVGVPKYYGMHYHYNSGHPRRRLCLTQLIDDGNFGRKREKAGNYRPDPWRRMVYGYGHRSSSLVSFFVLLHHRPPAGSR
ncbi:hypothetical protein ALC62_08820 [Cyphomyrmex costatus]|uniref:Uncharacterized protein n=1 Tax=Cyphomyrmex costatus TaxID=456900 RepID=A0A195CJT1_9HYME|nr:hypothetical protein ALC62_08820 [Cyphomyrmex costatus]